MKATAPMAAMVMVEGSGTTGVDWMDAISYGEGKLESHPGGPTNPNVVGPADGFVSAKPLVVTVNIAKSVRVIPGSRAGSRVIVFAVASKSLAVIEAFNGVSSIEPLGPVIVMSHAVKLVALITPSVPSVMRVPERVKPFWRVG